MAVTIADIAHTLGTADDIIDSSATSGLAAATLTTGDILTVSGLTQYDTVSLDSAGSFSVDADNNLIYDDGSATHIIGTWDGGDGRTLSITFLATDPTVTLDETLIDALLQSLTISADTAGTVADSRTLTFAFTGTYAASDTSAYTIVGSGGADTIIYSAGAIGFDPGAGDDILLVKTGAGALSLDMKTVGALEKFEVLDATDANSAINLTLGSSVKTVTLGSAVDTINIADENDIGTVTVDGGAGRDILNVTAAATLTDTELAKFSNVEILQLSDNANTVTLGAANSIDTINGGTDVDTIDASARTVANAAAGFYDLVINAGDGDDVVTASQGHDHIDMGAGDDTLKISSTDLTVNDSLAGGAETTADTLEITDNTVTDAVFEKVTGFEKLQTGADAATDFKLGDKAFAAGIREIDASANSNSGATTIDLSEMTGDDAFVITAGSGDTTVKMTATNLSGDDTITGGAGADILQVSTAGTVSTSGVTAIETLELSSATGNYDVTIADTNDFSTIDATAASGNVTIDASAELDVTGGLTINTGSGNDDITTGDTSTGVTIDAGNGNNTITLGTATGGYTNDVTTGTGDDIVNMGAGDDTIDLGSGTDSVKVAYADFDTNDSVTGTGEVTLEFTDAVDDGTATVESKMVGAANAIDIIKLDDDSSQTVTLGANAKLSGVSTIDATAIVTDTNALTADLTAFATAAVTVKGGAGDDIVQMISADFTSATSIQGGGNTVGGGDTIEITDDATVVDADFTLSTGLETLLLSKVDSANTITVGDLAKAAGLETIDASAVTDATKAQTITVSMTNDTDLTIKTGAGADTIKMKGSQLTSGDTIEGGGNTDTLEFTDIVNVADAAFTGVDSVEKIKLSAGDAQTLTLAANAQAAGILEVDATAAGSVTIDASGMSVLPLKITTSTGNDTVSLGSGVSTVSTGAGDDIVKILTANLTSADSIDGGADTDTLLIRDAAVLTDSSFTKVSNFESVKLSDFDAQTISLGAAAAAKNIKNIDASALTGTNKVTVTLDSSYDAQTVKITGGAGADVLKVTDGTLTSTLTYIGGSGIDTLELSNAASIADADLAKIQEVETIKLADDSAAQTITLGTNASAAGINKVDGSAMLANGSVTVDASAMTNNMTITTVGGNDTITVGHGNDTVTTGAGDDTIKVASEYFNSSDTINGGANTTNGKDILEITSTNAAIGDSAFTNVTNIELIKLTANSLYTLTLGTVATANGLTNVDVTGTGGAKIDISALTADAIINGGSGIETITLGNNADTLNLGLGNDIIKVAAANLTTADTIDGGGGTDTIEITTATSGTLTDDDFNGIRNVETIKLTIDNTQDIALGDKAINAGITTVDASAMKTAGKTLSVDMSGMSTNQTMTIIGGYGDDTVKMKAGHLTSADTITGDLGNDTLEFSGAVTLVDADFTNVTGMETLKLSDADNQSVILGNEAANGGSGIKIVNASALTGTNKVTVDLSTMTNDLDMTVTTGAGADTIKTKAAHLSANDTLNGGGGTDTIEFIDQVSNLAASVFGGVTNIEKIKLSDTTASNAQSLTLANSATLNTVDATAITGAVTVDASAFTNALTINTGTGADVITVGSGVNTVSTDGGADKVIITSAALADANADTLDGGTGADILEVTGTTAITDAKLSTITGFETIALTGTGNKSITIGTNAKNGGVSTVDASITTGANTINASAFTGTVTLKGGSGVDTITAGSGANTIQAGNGDDIITIDATTFDLNDTIAGGAGTDTLVLTGVANLTDANFTNVTGIEKIVVADETGQSLVLGTNAKAAGIRTVDTSAVATTKTITVDISGMTSTDMTITGGAGNETIKMASADVTSADTISVGAGTDILELTTASELTAADMANISGFEKLKLANVDATQSLTLADGKFSEIDGSTITYAQAITIDAAAQTGALSITTKGGNDVITLGSGVNTLDSGSGDDTIKIKASTLNSSDTINAGNGTDTLEISEAATVVDTMFDNASGLEVIKLTTDAAGQSVTIASTHAGTAGVNKVDTTLVSAAVTVDISGMGTGVTVNTGSGADVITLGLGIDTVNAGGGNDNIKVANANLTSADVINGGTGTNTLTITDKAVITDDMLSGITAIDTIKLSDNANAQSVTLGANAKANTLLKVDTQALTAGHSATIDASGLSGKDITMTGGAGDDTVKMASADLTAADTITLGTGNDTLEFTDAVNLTNTALQAGLSGIEKITLGDFATTLTIKDGIGATLEINAQAATGVKAATIDASAAGTTTTSLTVKTSGGDDTVTVGSSATNSVDTGAGADTIILGSGANTVTSGTGNDIIKISNANLTNAAVETINGGDDTDELWVTTAGTIVDANLAAITNVEKLVLKEATTDQSVTIGTHFADNLFTTVDASALTTGKLTLDTTAAVKTGGADIDLTVTGGGADDTIIVKSTNLTSADTIDGGAGTDTLSIKNGAASTIADSQFTNVSNMEKLLYAGNYSHTLTIGDLAQAAGILSVDATIMTGSNKLTMDASSMTSDSDLTVKTGTGADEITMQADQLTATDLLQLGSGTNTLKLAGSDTLVDDDFNVLNSGVSKIVYTEDQAQTITVGTKMIAAGLGEIDATALATAAATVDIDAVAAAFTVKTGAGTDTITAGSGVNTISAGSGDDTIKIKAVNLTSADTINGEGGTDTLEITLADTLVDADFTGVTNVEILKLSDDATQSVTMGAKVTASGITTVDASSITTNTNSLTLDMTAMSSNKDMTITGSAGDDLIRVKSGHLTTDDVIDGGGNNTADVLEIVAASGTITVNDVDLTQVTNIDTLKITNTFGANTITLGDAAIAAGISTIDLSGNTNGGYATTVDLSTATADADFAVIGGSGADTIKMKSEDLTSNDDINGGNNIDVLQFTTAIDSADGTKFDNVSNIEIIKLAAGDDQKLTLNAYGSALTIDAKTNLAANSDKVTIDASAMTNNLTVNTAGGNDTVTIGTGVDTIDLGAGDDTLKTADGNLTAADTVKFGLGADSLEFTDAATVSDSMFTLVTGLEKIVLADGANTLVLGDAAWSAGINEIDGSASTGVLDVTLQAQSDTIATVTGGTGNDIITMRAGHLRANDTIDGGDGDDTLHLTGTGILTDDVFAGVTSIKTLKLDNANQDFTLGTNAINAGIDTIDTSAVTDAKIRLDLSAMTTNMTVQTKAGNDTIVLGSGDDTIDTGDGNDTIQMAGDRLTADDTIDGGAGTDVLQFTSAVNIADKAVFGGVSGIETIKLANAASQVLTLKAGVASTIDASALIGTNSVTVDATDMATDLTITTGSGNDVIIAGSGDKHTIDTGSGDDTIRFDATTDITAANDIIKGGLGKDTLEFTGTGAVSIDNDFFGTHITGIEVIKLADVDGHSIDLSVASKAIASGVNTIDSSAVGTGKDATINMAGFTGSVSVIGGAANETVTAGKGVDTYDLGDGDDVLNITTLGWTKNDTISMGDGADTLNLTDASIITDDMFTKVTGLEKIVLGDAAKDKTVTLGVYAKNSGLNEIDASALNGVGTAAKKAIIDAGAMTNDMTITTGTGNDTVTMGKGSDTITTGDGDDTIKVANAYFSDTDTIDGGAGTDTLYFLDSVSLDDASFTSVTAIDAVKLSDYDRQTLTLGDTAIAKGILNIDASLLSDGNRVTVDYSSATADAIIKVVGGKGDDTVILRAEDFTADDTLTMGNGVDTLQLTTASSGANAVEDNDFTKVTGLEVLELSDFDAQTVTIAAKAKAAGLKTIDATALTGANAVTVDASAMTSSMTINTGSGADTIIAGTGLDTIESGGGDDTITFTTATFAGDFVNGGSGTDTILISNLANISDGKFSGTTNVEVLKLSDIAGTSVVTLGAKAELAGIVTVDASDLTGVNKATIDTSAMTSDVEIKTGEGDDTVTLGSGISTVTVSSGNDTIKTAAANLTSDDIIAGGLGDDTLLVTTVSSGGDAIEDADFTNVSGVEIVKFSNFTAQTVTLGEKARLAGVNTIDATLLTNANNITVDTSAMSADVTIKGGTGADTFILGTSNDTIFGGAGNDTVQLKSIDLTSFDRFDGGSGTDIIEITDAATVVDDDFTGMTSMETVKLNDFASQSVSVGTNASVTSVGLKTIDASAVTQGVTVDASEATIALNIIGGSGGDTLYASKGANIITAGDGDDTIKIASNGFDSNDKIDAGTGTDTLEITDAANLVDASFTNINGIETIKLSDFASQSIVLGSNAQNKGIVSIDATALTGTNALNINTAAMTANKDLDIQTGDGDDIFTVRKSLLDANDVLKAGGGTDTLVFSDQVTINDAFFATLTAGASFETIALSNYSNQSIVLGANAETQGISTIDLSRITTTNNTVTVESTMASAVTVIGGAGNDTITAAAGDYNDIISGNAGNDIISIGGGDDTVSGDAGNDTIKVAIAKLDSADSIDGGIGNDTVEFTDAGTITDTKFTGLNSIEIIKLADGVNSITIAQSALDAGLTTINASASSSATTVDASGYTGNVTIYGGSGNDVITAGTGNDILIGGTGDDTYKFSSLNLTKNDKINDTGGVDTLLITDAASITDAMFTGIRGVDTLKLTVDVAGQSIVLGSLALSSGLKTIDIRGIDAANVRIDTTAFKGTLTVLSDTPGGTYKGGTGNDTFSLSDGSFDSTTLVSTISGSGGNDTLDISTSATVTDADFAQTTSVEIFKLSVGGSAVLGAKAKAAGIKTIDVSDATAAVTVDASGLDSTTTFIVDDSLSNADTLTGSSVTDIMSFKTDGTITDSQFAHVTDIETLKFARGDNTVTLGTNAAGTFTLLDATLSATANTSVYNVAAYAAAHTVNFKGGAGKETIQLTDTTFNGTHLINSGNGIDTIEITDTASIVDIDFGTSKIVGVEVFKLAAGGTATLGAKAQAAGINTIDIASASADSTINTAAMKNSITLNLGSNDDTITTGAGADVLNIAIADLDAADDIDLGGGNDIIQLSDAGTITDAQFTNVANVEILKLADGVNDVTLGTNASFKTLDGSKSTGATTVNVSAMTTALTMTLGSGDNVVTLGTKNHIVNSGAGNDTITMGSGAETINAGVGSDLIKVLSANFASTDKVDGSSGTDTLEITNAALMADAVWANKKGLEVLKLDAGGTVVLGTAAKAAGLKVVELVSGGSVNTTVMGVGMTINGGSGNDTITTGSAVDIINLDSGNDTVVAGGGNDTITISADELTSGDNIDGGAGTDTLRFTTASTNGNTADANFTNVAGIETVVFADFAAQEFAFGDLTKAAGVITLNASALTAGHGMLFDLSGLSAAAAMTLLGGAGDDTVKMINADFTNTDTISGGAGNDTIIITDAATITDAQLAKVTSVENMILAAADSSQSVVLSANAIKAGIVSVDASAAGSVTITNDMTTNKAMTLIGGTGDDTFKFKNATFDLGDTVTGAGGSDVIQITDKAVIIDTDFTNVSSVETLTLGNFSGQVITLGAKATTAGIRTVDGSAITTASNALIIDTNSMTAANLTLIGGAGNDTFRVKGSLFDGSDTITGSGGTDILQFSGATTLIDSDLAGVTDVEKVLLNAAANHDLTLGSNAEDNAKIATIDASKLGSANTLTLDASAYASVALTVLSGAGADSIKTGAGDDVITSGAGNDTIESGSGNDKIVAGDGNDTITSGDGNDTIDGGNGNDTFNFANADFDASDIIIGGGGNDTIVITDAATITDAQFAKVTTTENLVLAATDAAQSVTLSANAIKTGILKVDASATGSVTITSDTTTNKSMIFIGSTGNDTFVFKNATFDLADTVTGGAGTDIISISDKATIIDSDFNKVTNVETLQLDATGGTVTLATKAHNSGLNKVDGSSATAAVIIDAKAMTSGLTMLGGSAADKLYSSKAADTMTGNDGADVFVFSGIAAANGADTITDFTDGTDKIALTIAGKTAGGAMSDLNFGVYVQSITDDGTDTTITLAGGDTITLTGVADSSVITVADFIYG